MVKQQKLQGTGSSRAALERGQTGSSKAAVERGQTGSSYSNLYDFDDYDRYRVEEVEEFNRNVSVMTAKAHMEEQRRRLEHFLNVAQQARARTDIKKIEELLAELLSTGRLLSHSRINELKHLEVMTSPYNQTLITMLRVENA